MDMTHSGRLVRPGGLICSFAIQPEPAVQPFFGGVLVRLLGCRLGLEMTRSAPSFGERMLHPPLSHRT
jgi:hypothetical protein